MKLQNVKNKMIQGFTMIELLIVIAVLGILAVAVLSAINPIEQINRSKDTGARSDAEQLIGGVDRYYTQKGFYPWQSSATDTSNQYAMNQIGLVNTKNLSGNVLPALSNTTGELKSSFVNRVVQSTYNTLYLYNHGQQGDSTYVCFKPQSKAFEDDAVTRCGTGLPSDLTVANGTVCAASPSTLSCLP